VSASLAAARRLHTFLLENQWDGSGLVGPDMGIRANYRVGRFLKAYLRFVPWSDSLHYLQGQAYWSIANWHLAEAFDDRTCADVAQRGSERILSAQRLDGGWDYPNPAWSGRSATTEGTWAGIGLLEAYVRTGDSRFVDGARRWHAFVETRVGFQPVSGGVAVNYFADRRGAAIPNCSTLLLHFLGDLAAATGDSGYRARCRGLLAFLAAAQKPSGELPYAVTSPAKEARLNHFQCYQYNAFQCLDLIRYNRGSGDSTAAPLIEGLLRFLQEGVSPNGCARYECGRSYGSVTYHTAALAAAFAAADALGHGSYGDLARRACAQLLARQRRDGSFPHSRQDYRVLADRRSYPRTLAMIHSHLLVLAGVDPLTARQTSDTAHPSCGSRPVEGLVAADGAI
jgi:hypothetical protein